MATEEDVPLAQAVSAAFIEQYFLILQKTPKEARRLYVDGSVVSRPGPDGVMMSFTSVEAINEQYLSYDYENTTFEVLSVDSQSSFENGIVIMVVGFSTGKDNLRRKFCQMFYLARQDNVHVVVNDIFRYVDEEAFTTTTLPVFESVPATEIADVVNKTEPVRKIDVSLENSVKAVQVKNAAEVKDVVAGATLPLDNGNIKHSDEKSVTAQKPTEPVAEIVPQPDGGKRSFAAIVQSLAKNQAPFQVKASVQKPKHMVQPRAAAAPASFSKSEKKFDQKIIEEPGTSIFVANLPMNAVAPQLHELFKDFGPIKEDGVQVRSTRATATCYGFVAFESATSVQSVLQAARNDPFVLADRKLRVKEKEVDYDGSKPSSGRSGGGTKTPVDGDEFKPTKPNKNRRNGGRAPQV